MKTFRPITTPLLSTCAQQPLRTLPPPFLRQTDHQRQHQQQPQQQHHRTFLSSTFSNPQTITASRILPYTSRAIFSVISDVGAYSSYLPFCRDSTVTKHSSPAQDGKKYPEEAKLVVGYNEGVSEEFYSRVYCIPDTTVEAVSGSTNTSLPAEGLEHHSARSTDTSSDPTRREGVLSHLVTRWSLKQFPYKPAPEAGAHKTKESSEESPKDRTEVSLHIEFLFSNPVYAALSQAAAPKVADKMIEAFERRVREVVERERVGR